MIFKNKNLNGTVNNELQKSSMDLLRDRLKIKQTTVNTTSVKIKPTKQPERLNQPPKAKKSKIAQEILSDNDDFADLSLDNMSFDPAKESKNLANDDLFDEFLNLSEENDEPLSKPKTKSGDPKKTKTDVQKTTDKITSKSKKPSPNCSIGLLNNKIMFTTPSILQLLTCQKSKILVVKNVMSISSSSLTNFSFTDGTSTAVARNDVTTIFREFAEKSRKGSVPTKFKQELLNIKEIQRFIDERIFTVKLKRSVPEDNETIFLTLEKVISSEVL